MGTSGFTRSDFDSKLDQGSLMAARCKSCDALHLPPRALCPSCYAQDMEWEELSGHGVLSAFTTVHIAPTAMIDAGYGRANPYCAGIVELEEGPSFSGQILGVDATKPTAISIGAEVQAVFLDRGEGEETRKVLAFEVVGSED